MYPCVRQAIVFANLYLAFSSCSATSDFSEAPVRQRLGSCSTTSLLAISETGKRLWPQKCRCQSVMLIITLVTCIYFQLDGTLGYISYH